MEVADGKYTGKIRFYAYAENKAKAINDLARKRGYDLDHCYAYSDSITDLTMLEAVGHPFAVNPDKDLRKAAKERDWPILVFDRPVALGSRVKLPPAKPALAAIAIASAAGIGAAVWVNSRKARKRSA
jgi:phosphoserine phosphatase